MQLRLPHEIKTDQSVTVILDDGRLVHVYGSGEITVHEYASKLGSEDYSLTLPSVAYVGTHCDNQDDVMQHGRVSIDVQHRH